MRSAKNIQPFEDDTVLLSFSIFTLGRNALGLLARWH